MTLLKQYGVISGALIISIGITLFVPWPWTIFGGIPFILMLPLLLRHTSLSFRLECLNCASQTMHKVCPNCGGNTFKVR